MSVQNQIEELKVAMKEMNNRCHYERYQAFHPYLNGCKMIVIATIINRNRVTVSDYITV